MSDIETVAPPAGDFFIDDDEMADEVTLDEKDDKVKEYEEKEKIYTPEEAHYKYHMKKYQKFAWDTYSYGSDPFISQVMYCAVGLVGAIAPTLLFFLGNKSKKSTAVDSKSYTDVGLVDKIITDALEYRYPGNALAHNFYSILWYILIAESLATFGMGFLLTALNLFGVADYASQIWWNFAMNFLHPTALIVVFAMFLAIKFMIKNDIDYYFKKKAITDDYTYGMKKVYTDLALIFGAEAFAFFVLKEHKMGFMLSLNE